QLPVMTVATTRSDASVAGMNRLLPLPDDDRAVVCGLRSARDTGSARAGTGGEGRGVVLRAAARAQGAGPGHPARARARGGDPCVFPAVPGPVPPAVAGLVLGGRAPPAANLAPPLAGARAALLGPAAERLRPVAVRLRAAAASASHRLRHGR